MSLLSNLVLFGNGESTSLDLCQSPKAFQPPYFPPLMSAQKQPIPESDRPRPASKSLSKMTFFSPVQKIDPKERLIHRLFYKLEMKCRKHYYNFFVKLENIKKKPVNIKNSKLIAVFPKVLQRLNQISELLFSKYFERTLVKQSFKRIKKMAKTNEGVKRINKMINNRKTKYFFSRLVAYSKRIQKDHIRIDILVSSLKSLASQRSQNFLLLKSYAFKLITQYVSAMFISPNLKLTAFQCSSKEEGEKITDINLISPFTLIKEIDVVPHPVYKQLKSAKKNSESFLTKPCDSINIRISKYKNPFQKINYLKACPISIERFFYQPFENLFSNENPNIFSQRFQIDLLNSKQVNDIYDRNTIFFSQSFKDADYFEGKQRQAFLFSQSQVQSVNLSHLLSQASLIAPLSQQHQAYSHNTSVSSARSSTFGQEAVNFKNSLVSQRESMKDYAFRENKPEQLQQFEFKKNSFGKGANKLEIQPYQSSPTSQQNPLKIKFYNQNIKQPDRTHDHLFSKTAANSFRQSFNQPDTEKRILQGRKSIEQSKRNSFREDARKPQQTFLKITKKY